jgi:hypothetical protein
VVRLRSSVLIFTVVQPRTDSGIEAEEVDGMLVISSAGEQVDLELALAARLLSNGRLLLWMSLTTSLTEDLIITAVSVARSLSLVAQSPHVLKVGG